MEIVHRDCEVEIFIGDCRILTAKGYNDYKNKFTAISADYRNNQKIQPLHSVTPAKINLPSDGKMVTTAMTFDMAQRRLSQPHADIGCGI